MLDLFGQEIKEAPVSNAKRKPTVRKGYAGIPGRGPEGETCRTCEHSRLCGQGHAKTFYKCVLVKRIWTHGQGTDILAKSPACERWQAKTNKEEA